MAKSNDDDDDDDDDYYELRIVCIWSPPSKSFSRNFVCPTTATAVHGAPGTPPHPPSPPSTLWRSLSSAMRQKTWGERFETELSCNHHHITTIIAMS
ncbi:hypothetical protein M0804_000066 [Polistes exclamans]|nr:hypothetical protein M0804_000066 [Polistes exclamans]